MRPHEQFVERVSAFIRKSGLSASRFGELACNDPCFVADLRDGREPRSATIEKVERFMATWKPPADVGKGSSQSVASR